MGREIDDRDQSGDFEIGSDSVDHAHDGDGGGDDDDGGGHLRPEKMAGEPGCRPRADFCL